MKRMLITVVAAALLTGCMTPVDYSKPWPLKEGEAKRAKIKHDLPESERSIVARKILKSIGGWARRKGRFLIEELAKLLQMERGRFLGITNIATTIKAA